MLDDTRIQVLKINSSNTIQKQFRQLLNSKKETKLFVLYCFEKNFFVASTFLQSFIFDVKTCIASHSHLHTITNHLYSM